VLINCLAAGNVEFMPAASVLLVPVPDAEATVAPFRRGLDPTYRQKMPAHVTVLVPFMPPMMIDDAVIDNLTSLFRGFGGFEFVLRELNWFDKRVLYLEPEPAEPFRLITTAVVKQFPDYPPYEGAFDDIVPHLTIGESGRWRKRHWRMRRAATRVEPSLPIFAYASEIWLMVLPENERHWHRLHTFALPSSNGS